MKAIVVANWKMNPATWREAKKLFEATRKAADKAKHITIVVCPPAIYLRDLKTHFKSKRIAFGLQNAHEEAIGAHTGEISIAQGKDAGAQYVIVGHAERRAQGETNEDTGRKVAAVLAETVVPVLCVGESERTHTGEHFALVKEQVRAGFTNVQAAKVKNVVVVYEPLWTIGKNVPMSPHEMHEMAIFIRKSIVEYKGETAMNVRILYGGSIDEQNAGVMLREAEISGLLVGRASEDPTKVAALLQAIENA